MKCFYHSDIDGKCAGAIVKRHRSEDDNTYSSGDYISIDYKDDFPFDKIEKHEKVFIVDFSLQKPGDFTKLLEITDDVVWIDHHISAIEKHQEHSGLIGIRDIAFSGCELTWMYLFGDQLMPTAVEYAGRYDVWDFSEHGEILNEFQAGIGLYDNEPEDAIWQWLLQDNKKLPELMTRGETALLYRRKFNAELIKDFAFYANFEGYRAVCCNAGRANSQLFDSVKEDYDIMLAFVTLGCKQWKVSIYTKRDDIDCSKIATKYGGGGHKGAAGFLCENLPFKHLK